MLREPNHKILLVILCVCVCVCLTKCVRSWVCRNEMKSFFDQKKERKNDPFEQNIDDKSEQGFAW